MPDPLRLPIPGHADAFYYRAHGKGPKPVLMYLHGRGNNPQEDCRKWARVATEFGWVVCPGGDEDRGNGARSWGNNPVAGKEITDRALEALGKKYKGRVQKKNNILIGFSEGAFVAMQIGLHDPATWGRWLILAANDQYWFGDTMSEIKQHKQLYRRVFLLTGESGRRRAEHRARGGHPEEGQGAGAARDRQRHGPRGPRRAHGDDVPAAALVARVGQVETKGQMSTSFVSAGFETDLESVRDLATRFPAAHLRPVTCIRAHDLDALADPSGSARVWLAIESLQVTGSFKVRGALVALDALQRAARTNGQQRPRVVAASAGNHGAGVAYAAKVLGCDATVVVPANAPLAKRSKIAAYGCTIIVSSSPHYDDAEAEAQALAASTGAHFVSPYDDVDVLTGNGASLGFEIARAIGRVPDRALVPFGGGGLASGMAAAFAHEANESLASTRRVWGVQSDISPAMAMSLARGARGHAPRMRTLSRRRPRRRHLRTSLRSRA